MVHPVQYQGDELSPNVIYKNMSPAEQQKMKNIFELLTPLTLPYQDKEGRTLQLWKYKNDFVGSIQSNYCKIDFISSSRIRNPLQLPGTSTDFLNHIEKMGLRKWSLVYDKNENRISVWPCLIAAGQDDSWKPPTFPYDPSTLGHIFKGTFGHFNVDTPENRNLIQQATNSQGNFVGKDCRGNEVYFKVNPDGTQSWAVVRNGEIRNGGLNIAANHWHLNPDTKRITPQFQVFDPRKNQQAKVIKDVFFKGQARFAETVDHHKLTKSYNSCHPKSPILPKSGGSGQIGGVATSAGKIKKLFSGIEHLFDTEHFFAIPSLNGEPPFSYTQLQQLLRELAIGIYLHDAVPFFSLDFNAKRDLAPVIHFAYQNTLVGKVISMLDYFMKGYLNGGVFKETVLSSWESYREKKREDLFQHIIDFHEYVKINLPDAPPYLSLRQILISLQMKEEGSETAIPHLEEECLHLTSSFRIIAKQQSIQKEENLFVLDADFDVLYTLEPEGGFKEKIDSYGLLRGKEPKAMQQLRKAYDIMASRIKQEMPKLPLCKELFAMLHTISFFSHYFTTLKAKGKVPNFFPIQAEPTFVPPVFPALPLRTVKQEPWNIHCIEFFAKLTPDAQQDLLEWIKTDSEEDFAGASLPHIIEKWVECTLKQFSQAVQQELQREEGSKRSKKHVLNFLKKIKADVKEKLLEREPSSELLSTLLAQIPPVSFNLREHVLELASELEEREREAIKNVIGGCGLHFGSIPISSSRQGELLLSHNRHTLHSLLEGAWQPLFTPAHEKPGHFAFSLSFSDIAAKDNDDFLFLLQTLNPSQQLEEWNAVAKRIREGDESLLSETRDWTAAYTGGQTFLHMAASCNNTTFCRFLLNLGLAATTQDRLGQTAAHYACAHNAHEALSLLLEHNPSLAEIKDQQHELPLHTAARHGSILCVQALIKGPIPEYLIVTKNVHDLTPLMIALRNHHFEIAKLFIPAQSIFFYMPQPTATGHTELIEAIEQKNSEIALQLLNQSWMQIWSQRKDGYDAFFVAISLGDKVTVKEFLETRFSSFRLLAIKSLPNGDSALHLAVRRGDLEMCKLLIQYVPELLIRRTQGNCSALLLALLQGKQAISLFFIETIKEILQKYENRWNNPLHALQKISLSLLGGLENAIPFSQRLRHAQPSNELPCIEYCGVSIIKSVKNLFPLGTYPLPYELREILNERDSDGVNPLSAACSSCSIEPLKELIALEAEVPPLEQLLPKLALGTPPLLQALSACQSLTSEQQDTLLRYALRAANPWLLGDLLQKRLPEDITLAKEVLEGCILNKLAVQAKACLEKHPSLSESCFQGRGILSWAAACGSGQFLEWAIQKYKTSEKILDAVEAACSYGRLTSAKILLPHMNNRAVPLNAKKMNAAHIAAAKGHVDVVEFFIKRQCRSEYKDAEGNDTLDHALMNDHYEVVLLLSKHGHPIQPRSLSLVKKAKVLSSFLDMGSFTKEELSQALIDHIEHGRIEAICALLNAGADPDMFLANRWTALTFAAAKGQEEALAMLLPYSRDRYHVAQGGTCMHHATANHHVECVTALISKGYTTEYLDYLKKVDQFGSTLMFLPPEKIASQGKDFSPEDHLFLCGDGKRRPLLLATLCAKKGIQKETIDELLALVPTVSDKEGSSVSHILAMMLLPPHEKFPITEKNKDGMTALHIYTISAPTSLLQQVVSEKVDVNIRCNDGITPLHLAVANQDAEKVDIFIKAKADVNAETNDGSTPLQLAAANGNAFIVKVLLKAGAKPNTLCKPPLHHALMNNHEELAFFLVQNGASPYCIDEDGRCPVHYAAKSNCVEFLRYLHEQKTTFRHPDKEGLFPEQIAAKAGNSEALQIMLQAGSRPTIAASSITTQEFASRSANMKTLEVLWHQGNNMIETNGPVRGVLANAVQSGVHEHIEKLMKTPFGQNASQLSSAAIVAIQKDDPKTLKMIQEQGFPLAIPFFEGRNALHWACAFGAKQAATFCLESGIDGNEPDNHGMAPLQIAAQTDKPRLLRYLLEVLPLPDERDNRSLLHLAAAKGATRNLAVLLSRGFDVNAVDALGETALHEACINCHVPCIELLLLSGANPEIRSRIEELPRELIPDFAPNVQRKWDILLSKIKEYPQRLSPLLRAIFLNAKKYWPLLVQIADVNARDTDGNTPLHLAVIKQEYPLMELLLRKQADILAKNSTSQTPLDLAQKLNDQQSIHLLSLQGGHLS